MNRRPVPMVVIDVLWGVLLALLVLAVLFLGTSGPKFIYIDF